MIYIYYIISGTQGRCKQYYPPKDMRFSFFGGIDTGWASPSSSTILSVLYSVIRFSASAVRLLGHGPRSTSESLRSMQLFDHIPDIPRRKGTQDISMPESYPHIRNAIGFGRSLRFKGSLWPGYVRTGRAHSSWLVFKRSMDLKVLFC